MLYKAIEDLNPYDYPFKGANPIMDSPNLKDVNSILKGLDHGDALTWNDAHELCYFLIHQTRLFIEQDLQEKAPIVPWKCQGETLQENLLRNGCIHSVSYLYVMAIKLGLKGHIKALHTYSFMKGSPLLSPKDKINHAFVLLTLPISQNGKTTKHSFILDPTFRQFFADYDTNNAFATPVKFDNSKTLGARISQQYNTQLMADHLLKFGFVYAGHFAKKAYIAHFVKDPDIAITEDALSCLYKNVSAPANIHATISSWYYTGMRAGRKTSLNDFIFEKEKFYDSIRSKKVATYFGSRMINL